MLRIGHRGGLTPDEFPVQKTSQLAFFSNEKHSVSASYLWAHLNLLLLWYLVNSAQCKRAVSSCIDVSDLVPISNVWSCENTHSLSSQSVRFILTLGLSNCTETCIFTVRQLNVQRHRLPALLSASQLPLLSAAKRVDPPGVR